MKWIYYHPIHISIYFGFLIVFTLVPGCKVPGIHEININAKPNIILIVVDDLGWRDMGCMGNPYYQTPGLDRLASKSVVFTSAYAPAANCAPSRACILSGKNTPRHGIYTVGSSERGKSVDRKLIPIENNVVLEDSIVTIAESLKVHGYVSSSIGKWHLGENPVSQGFDINIGGSEAGHPKSYFSPYRNPALPDGPKGEYLTDRLTEEAISFISTNKENPFFLYLPYFSVHTPLQGKADLVDKYAQIIGDDERYNSIYGAMIETLDQNIQRILEALAREDLDNNTMLIFTSDNGGLAKVSTQAPLRAGKGSYYEGGIRVPFIIHWPAMIDGHIKTKMPITGMDIFPTIMELVGDTNDYLYDGQSLLQFLRYGKEFEERTFFWHFPIYLQGVDPVEDGARDPKFRTRPGSVIRKGNWKLHEYFEDGGLELYDLNNDLGEQENLIKSYPEIGEALLEELRLLRVQMNAPVPSMLNPDFLSTTPKE